MIKHIPNALTVFRILGSALLLWVPLFSGTFYILYLLCGVSDILDGYIARKTQTATPMGAILDSFADFLFVGIMLFLFLPVLALPTWAWTWTIGIAFIKMLSLGIGWIKYHTFAFLHTYMNKLAGMLLFLFPLFYMKIGLQAAAFLCTIASLAAVEECLLLILKKELSYDVKSLFFKS